MDRFLDKNARRRPLCYDSKRKKFITFDEIVSGKEKIIPLEALSDKDLRLLVIERWSVLPKHIAVRPMSGPPLTRDEVIRSIQQNEPFGLMTFEAEKTHLENILNNIRLYLDKNPIPK